MYKCKLFLLIFSSLCLQVTLSQSEFDKITNWLKYSTLELEYSVINSTSNDTLNFQYYQANLPDSIKYFRLINLTKDKEFLNNQQGFYIIENDTAYYSGKNWEESYYHHHYLHKTLIFWGFDIISSMNEYHPYNSLDTSNNIKFISDTESLYLKRSNQRKIYEFNYDNNFFPDSILMTNYYDNAIENKYEWRVKNYKIDSIFDYDIFSIDNHNIVNQFEIDKRYYNKFRNFSKGDSVKSKIFYDENKYISFNKSSYKLIMVWGSWCGPCKNYKPLIDSLRGTNDLEIEFFSISEKDTTRLNREIEKYSFYPNFNVTNEEFRFEIGAVGVPTILITKGNEVIFFEIGYSEEVSNTIFDLIQEELVD